jgi:hypothetical protein
MPLRDDLLKKNDFYIETRWYTADLASETDVEDDPLIIARRSVSGSGSIYAAPARRAEIHPA